MRKLLLTISAIALTYMSNAQVIVAGVSPQSIVANYTHTWADPASGWATPDFRPSLCQPGAKWRCRQTGAVVEHRIRIVGMAITHLRRGWHLRMRQADLPIF